MDLFELTKRQSMKVAITSFLLSCTFFDCLLIVLLGTLPLDKFIKLDSSAGLIKVNLTSCLILLGCKFWKIMSLLNRFTKLFNTWRAIDQNDAMMVHLSIAAWFVLKATEVINSSSSFNIDILKISFQHHLWSFYRNSTYIEHTFLKLGFSIMQCDYSTGSSP